MTGCVCKYAHPTGSARLLRSRVTRHGSRVLALLLALAAAGPTHAGEKAPLPAVPDVRTIVRERGNAVVRVETREDYLPGLARRAGRLLNPFPLTNTIQDVASFAVFLPSFLVPAIRKEVGSGVIFDPKGEVLTNEHVVNHGDRVYVQLTDAKEVRRTFRARVVGKDPEADLALLQIEPKDVPLVVAPLGDSEELALGDWLITIGNPLDLRGSVAVGIVSGLHRQVGVDELEDHIQVDLLLNPGNSGGPLLNTRGEVVGLASIGSFPSNGIGFGVPTSLFTPFLDDFRKEGRPRRGQLGLLLRDLTPRLAKQKRLDVEAGVLVAGVAWASPAERAGIQEGDVLVSVAGQPAAKARDTQMAILRTRPGTEVDVQVRREGKVLPLRVTVGERRRPLRLF